MGLSLSALLLIAAAAVDDIHVPRDHPTIQAAIDAAKSGDRVIIAPGTYRERIRLREGVTARSAGDDARGKLGLKRAEAVILDGGGTKGGAPGVTMAEGAVLDGVTVTRVGTYDDASWKKHHATRGAEQHHEHIGNFGTPAVGVVKVTCTIVNTIIHHNGDTGIGIRGGEAARCAPLVRGNVVYRNMGGGIGSMEGSSAVIEGNTCFENFYAGIGHNNARPLVIDNECYGNIRAGIGISEGATPVVRGNRCYRNRRAGIGIRTGAETRPLVEGNECFENGMAGIGTDEGAAPIIRNNHCHHNEMVGIGQQNDARTILQGNHVHDNALAGIGFAECASGSSVVIDNRVHDNGRVAVGIHAGWKVRFAGNELSQGKGMPPVVMVFKGAEAVFVSNRFDGVGVAGIRAAGTVRAVGNTFTCASPRAGGPPSHALWGLPGAVLHFSGNVVRDWRHAVYADKAAVTAVGNRVSGHRGAGIRVHDPVGSVTITGNRFEEGKGATGVELVNGRGTVRDNLVDPPEQK